MKVGWKTTEFWVTMGMQLVGVGVTLGYLTPDQAVSVNAGISDMVAGIAQIVGGAIMALTALGYIISRGIAKMKKKAE